MSVTVMLWVITAAALHAAWNLGVKSHDNPDVSMTAVVLGHSPVALIALWWVPLPLAAAWPWLLLGACLHLAYQLTLMSAYRLGDLSHVYPLARGTAPLLVTLISLLFLDKQFNALELTAVALIVVALLSQVRLSATKASWHAARLSLFTGCLIASYTLIDGYGARIAATGVGFYAVMALLNTGMLMVVMRWRRPGTVTQVIKHHKWLAIQGGSASFAAYAIVMWAFTQSPIALVSALRETSVAFAVMMGMVFLKERPTPRALWAVILMLIGLIVLRLAPALT
jgi:uncharacterized membrane protein